MPVSAAAGFSACEPAMLAKRLGKVATLASDTGMTCVHVVAKSG
jgi:hypothetical protein